MCVWEVDDEVEPIALLFSNLWELLLCYAQELLYYARRRGLVECIHDRCESYYLMVNLRWIL